MVQGNVDMITHPRMIIMLKASAVALHLFIYFQNVRISYPPAPHFIDIGVIIMRERFTERIAAYQVDNFASVHW